MMPGARVLLSELRARGLLHQATAETELARHLATGRRRVYAGFDPTADSLTIGNLVPIMLLRHAQRAGHEPVVVMGGGTGCIGDPSGKSAERELMTLERVEANVRAQRRIFERLLGEGAGDGAGGSGPLVLNNHDWLARLGYLEAPRDIGKHFSVNAMIQKESVRERLEAREQGISYTEFSYMVLQAYDFAHLHAAHGVTVQAGGSDQWGNIVAGVDLIRRFAAERGAGSAQEAYGLTAPLVTRADGGKFGKTEAGAIWLTPERTSAYAMHQFWLNTADADVGRFLRFFTLLPVEEIVGLEARHAAQPAERLAQRELAGRVTEMVHGPEARAQAELAARALFSGELRGLTESLLLDALSAAPRSEHARTDLAGEGVPALDVLARTTLAGSRTQARKHLEEGSIQANGRRLEPDSRLTLDDLLHGSVIALRRGKKTWHVTLWR